MSLSKRERIRPSQIGEPRGLAMEADEGLGSLIKGVLITQASWKDRDRLRCALPDSIRARFCQRALRRGGFPSILCLAWGMELATALLPHPPPSIVRWHA